MALQVCATLKVSLYFAEYLAPEFIFHSGNDRAVDLWSLGVMIFEMYLLYTPFTSPKDPTVDVESVFATIAKIQVKLIFHVLRSDSN